MWHSDELHIHTQHKLRIAGHKEGGLLQNTNAVDSTGMLGLEDRTEATTCSDTIKISEAWASMVMALSQTALTRCILLSYQGELYVWLDRNVYSSIAVLARTR